MGWGLSTVVENRTLNVEIGGSIHLNDNHFNSEESFFNILMGWELDAAVEHRTLKVDIGGSIQRTFKISSVPYNPLLYRKTCVTHDD